MLTGIAWSGRGKVDRVDVSLDGVPVDASQVLNYKGVMYSNVPNMAVTFGYTNASWTLKADMLAKWFCGLMKHMDHIGAREATPVNKHGQMETRPFVDMQSGYLARMAHTLQRQGMEKPWKLNQNYFADRSELKSADYDEGTLEYGNLVVTTEPRTA